MIEEDYVSFETAKLLKEKGFNEPTMHYFNADGTKRKFQQAHYLGYYELLGLGAKFDKKIEKNIQKVTPQDIKKVANKYLTENFVISLLAPEKFLDME